MTQSDDFLVCILDAQYVYLDPHIVAKRPSKCAHHSTIGQNISIFALPNSVMNEDEIILLQ